MYVKNIYAEYKNCRDSAGPVLRLCTPKAETELSSTEIKRGRVGDGGVSGFSAGQN